MIAGRELTKTKRHELFGAVAGKAGAKKLENWQRKNVEMATGVECITTNLRINLMTNEMKNIANPNVLDDGFNYSEDFDGYQYINGKNILLNFKCVAGTGGSQTRSLREVYWFVYGQLNYSLKSNKYYFANILDGDEADRVMNHYRYLLNLSEFKSVKSRFYIGDSKGYPEWIQTLNTPDQTECVSGHTPDTVGEKGSTSPNASVQENH
jgi:hypothetical protein